MSAVLELAHPIHADLARLEDAVGEVAGYSPVFLSPDDKAAVLLALTRIGSMVEAARMQVLAVAGDLAERDAAKDAGAWLSTHAHVDRKTAHSLWKLATQVTDSAPLGTAMATGQVSPDHARVITRVLEDLPHDLPAPTIAAAQARLITEAARFRPNELRRLGARILDLIAPELAEQAEARRLLALEEEAAKKTRLSITTVGDGTTKVYATVPDAVGTRLRTMVEAFAQPRLAALQADGRTRPHAQVMGEAFGQLLETIDPDRVPLHGGDATTVIITIGLDQLRRDLAAATIEGAETTELSASQARRLACTADIIPAVLDSESQPLDLGRSRRLFTPAQRKALKLRDHGCRAEDCTVPATWCDAHHDHPWSQGGPTDLDNALLLCNHHHHKAHDPRYTQSKLPNGKIRFHLRT